MQELIKVIGLLPVVNGKHALGVLDMKRTDFTILADEHAVGNALGIREFTIESATLKDLGIGEGETAYLVETGDADAPYRVEYTPKATKVAQESLTQGRGATPNFSIQR